MKKNNKVIIGVVVAVVLVIVAVVAMGGKKSGNTSQTNASSTTATATNTVSIKDYMFGPGTIKVKVGTKVTWTNQDAVNHTITADTPSSDAPSSMDVGKGQSYSFTFAKAGTYAYHCFPHPYMHGTVVVTSS